MYVDDDYLWRISFKPYKFLEFLSIKFHEIKAVFNFKLLSEPAHCRFLHVLPSLQLGPITQQIQLHKLPYWQI